MSVDKSALARDMLLWEEKQREIQAIEERIKNAVLVLEKTQVVGDVRATYSGGRRAFDYEAGARPLRLTAEQLKPYEVTKVDWKRVCDDNAVEAPYTKSVPSVTIKLEN